MQIIYFFGSYYKKIAITNKSKVKLQQQTKTSKTTMWLQGILFRS